MYQCRNIIEGHEQTTTNTCMSVINELITIRIIEQENSNDIAQQYESTHLTKHLYLPMVSLQLLIPRSIFKGNGSFLYSWHSDTTKGIISHPAPMTKYELIPPPTDPLGFYLQEN